MIRGAFIGIDRHADPFIGDLTGASRDATALWAVLSDSIADLHAPLITDDAATLAAMRDVLDGTLGAADEEDVVILGFAGHGTQDHRLVLHDTSVADLPNTTLGMDELAQRFRETRTRAVILLLAPFGWATAEQSEISWDRREAVYRRFPRFSRSVPSMYWCAYRTRTCSCTPQKSWDFS